MQLRDERDLSRELVSHQRMWSGPVFALDADTLRLEPGADPIGRPVFGASWGCGGGGFA